MAEANSRKSLKKVDGEKIAQGVYVATFTDGTIITADIRDLPTSAGGKFGEAFDRLLTDAPMVARELIYGHKQKLDDSMAGCETVEEAIEELKSTWEAIVSGNWTLRVPGEGVEGGLFARAYAEYHGLSLADAKAKISGLIAANLAKALAKNAGKPDAPEITERMVMNKIREVAFERYPDLKVKYDELKAKKAAKKKAPTAGLDDIEV